MFQDLGGKLVCEANVTWIWQGTRHYGRITAILPSGKIIVDSGIKAFLIDTERVKVRRMVNHNTPKSVRDKIFI